MMRRFLLLLFSVIPLAPSLFCDTGSSAGKSAYPEIGELLESNVLFRQLSEDVALFYRNMKAGEPIPPIVFYSYRTKPGEDIYTISAHFNLSYESIALLNGISSVKQFPPGTMVIIPNMPGLFVPESPETDLEMMMASGRDPSAGIPVTVKTPNHGDRLFRYLPGERFSSIELSYFLGILFRFPLRTSGVISSGFGFRASPFSGDRSFHHRIDIAAPRGTEAIAAREGTVIETGYDSIYGNYIVIRHQSGYETVYGHLDAVLVQLNQTIHSSMIIGNVGSTGLSTGPHLHFEIRKKGEAVNPSTLLPRNVQ